MKKKLIIITLIMTVICSTVNADYSWSNETKTITDLEFKEIVSENTPYDVMNEDFTTYTGNYKYNNVLNAIFKNTYHKAFFDMGDNKLGIRYNTSPWKLSVGANRYTLNYLITLVFDFQNKTLNYQSIDTNTEYFIDKGWQLSGDTTSEEFQSYAYQQNIIYETYFLVLGEFYSTSNLLLNGVEDYEINEMSYDDEIYTGKIIFSYDDNSWITSDLSETFYSGDEKNFSYYLEAYDYTENGVDKGITTEKLIGSIYFSSEATYHPSVEQVEQAMKEIDGYMNYAYTISLRPFESTSTHLLSSDLFIVDAKPIALIPYFKYKYDYLYYGGYITPPEETPSGDNGNGNIAGDIEQGNNNYWGSQEDINKENQENLISGEISGVIDNASEEMQKNEVFGLLSDYHDKIWGMFIGEEDFKIEWNSVQYMEKELIPTGSINFTEICEEEPFSYIKYLVNTIVSFGIIVSLIQQIYNLILSTLGIDNPYLYEDENYMTSTDAVTGEVKEKYYKNRRVYKK